MTPEIIGIVLSNLIVVLGAAMKLSGDLNTIKANMKSVSERAEKLEAKLETSNSDRVKIERLEQDVQELRRALFHSNLHPQGSSGT